MERIIEMTPGYDKREEGYGIHGVDLRMVLKGPKGAVQFVLYTGWLPPKTRREFEIRQIKVEPLPADVGYHSPIPKYEGHEPMNAPCLYLDDQPCYYDGSGLRANDAFDILTEKGADGVWAYLEEEYESVFGKEDR